MCARTRSAGCTSHAQAQHRHTRMRGCPAHVVLGLRAPAAHHTPIPRASSFSKSKLRLIVGQHRAHPSLTPTPGASRHRHTDLAQFACRLEHSKALCLPGRTGGPRARACVGWDGRQHCAGHALLRRRVQPHAHTTMPPRPGAFWACRVVVVVGAGCPHAMERNVGSKPRPASMRYQCRRCGCAGAASATRDISGTARQTLPRQPAAQRQ